MPDDFEVILDRCLADIAAGHETIDSCLRRYPAQSGQLAVLLPIAERARRMSPPAPLAVDKRRALESRLLRRAGQLRSKPVLRAPVWRRRVALALAAFVVVVLLLGSAVSVSAGSVPGDLLYPVKRAAEQVRLTLASQQQRVSLYLDFAAQRLQELHALGKRGEVSKDLLAEISSDTALALEQIPELPQPAQAALLTSLANFENQQSQALEDMASSAQGDARAALLAALADSTVKHKRAVDLLAKAGADHNPAPVPSQVPSPAGIPATQPAQGHPAVNPASTGIVEPLVTVAPQPTSVSPSDSLAPTSAMEEHAPPGQARQSTPESPPGQVKQSTPHSPPGQERQSTSESPGQVRQSTPHSPPGQDRQSTPESPPGQVKQTTPHSPPGQDRQSTPESPPEKPVKTPQK